MWNLTKFVASRLSRSRRFFSSVIPRPCIIQKRGADILHDPWINKETGFPLTERNRLGLRGLLPPRVISFEQQYARFMESYRSLEKNTVSESDTSHVALAKWRILNRLHDRNETLYFRVLIDNIKDFAPIIYTPTVGLVCQNYSGLFRRPRGMYFSAKDKGEMMSMIYNWPAQKGTAGVALAGLLGTVRAQGRSLDDFPNQKIVVVGAGSAGLGVLSMAVQAVVRMTGNAETAAQNFFLLDKDGLLTKERKNLDPAAVAFAKDPGLIAGLRDGDSLLEVVKKVKPDVLLGLSGVGGVFNEEVLKALRESGSNRPAIFAMSNPTMNAECTAVEAFKHAGENIVFASGSPFENVQLGNGKVGYVNQANNMYLFPGIGLGALLSGARIITNDMLQAAAECLASYMTDQDIEKGILYPSINSIRDITAEVGASVVRAAVAEEVAEGYGKVDPEELAYMSKEETVEYVRRNMWYPNYSPLVQQK
ncbi:hypothetical protein V6Z11_D11G098900 [Gossypium hirsutum]